MEPYILSELQFKALQASAHSGGAIFFQEPNPLGTTEEREEAAKELKMVDELISLGLMEDACKENERVIQAFKEQYGYGVKFYRVTENGMKMFTRENLVVN